MLANLMFSTKNLKAQEARKPVGPLCSDIPFGVLEEELAVQEPGSEKLPVLSKGGIRYK